MHNRAIVNSANAIFERLNKTTDSVNRLCIGVACFACRKRPQHGMQIVGATSDGGLIYNTYKVPESYQTCNKWFFFATSSVARRRGAGSQVVYLMLFFPKTQILDERSLERNAPTRERKIRSRAKLVEARRESPEGAKELQCSKS